MKWSYLSITSFWNFLPRISLLVPPYFLRVKLISLQGIAQCVSRYFGSCFLSTSTFSPCCLKHARPTFYPCCLKHARPFSLHTFLYLQHGSHICKKHLNPILYHYPLSPSCHFFYNELFFGNHRSIMALLWTYGLQEKCPRQKVNRKKIQKRKKKKRPFICPFFPRVFNSRRVCTAEQIL